MLDDSEHVDRLFHIEAMKGELEELSDGQVIMGNMGGELPPAMEEQFLEQVLAYERAEMVTRLELLARDGVVVPPPEELNDDELALKLIEVIHTLANHRIFLESTNHLSDRELYTQLYSEALDESGPILPPEHPMNCHLDMIGTGSEEDNYLYLKYYADDRMRASWQQDFPDMELPPHEDPPYDRDRHLPKPPPPPDPYDDPEVVTAFLMACRERLVRKLEKDGVTHGIIHDEPISYAPDVGAVWGVEVEAVPGMVGWWAISGDLPTTYLAANEYPDPRAFLREVSRRWQEDVAALERGDAPSSIPPVPEEKRESIVTMLNFRAQILSDWADDDHAWEEAG